MRHWQDVVTTVRERGGQSEPVECLCRRPGKCALSVPLQLQVRRRAADTGVTLPARSECLETVIIVSVLLSFIKQTIGPDKEPVVYKKLIKQVWYGVGAGLLICLIIGGGMIGAWYGFGTDHFANTEDIWEGTFGLIASLIITVMGAALLRVSKLQDKWRIKIAQAVEKQQKDVQGGATTRFKHLCQKYAMFLLPFVTVLREGLEAVVFIGGVGLGLPATAFPLAVICGLLAGILVGYLIYRSDLLTRSENTFTHTVLGLFSKAVWYFENYAWGKIIGGDASETGSGPGSYDIRKSVWHVNCCNPEINGGGGWGIFNALFGWQNSATLGTVLAYNFYWIAVIVVFLSMMYNEKKGHWPFMKAKVANIDAAERSGSDDASNGIFVQSFEKKTEGAAAGTTVRELTV
nr:plasma membrane iron permease [Quercus suber]